MSKRVTEDDLMPLFSRYKNSGTEIDIMVGKGKLKCQGFVTYTTTEEATYALRELQEFELLGKKMIISYAKCKDNQDNNASNSAPPTPIPILPPINMSRSQPPVIYKMTIESNGESTSHEFSTIASLKDFVNTL